MKVILFTNGMVMVFDHTGQQVPELQGKYDEVKDRIRAVYDGPWSFGCFQAWETGGLSFEVIEFTVRQLKACWKEE